MPQDEYNWLLYFHPIKSSCNSSLNIAYSEEYDNISMYKFWVICSQMQSIEAESSGPQGVNCVPNCF